MSVVFQPHPGAQTRFMEYTGRYALYGGAAGGGKSQCLLFDPFRQIQVESKRVADGDIPTSTGRCIFFRRTMPELREVMDRAHRFFPLIDPIMGEKGWHEQTKTWTFSCGYKYMFGQMEDDSDWIKYYGFEFTELLFDELTTFTEEQFDQLDTRVRSSDPVLKDMLYVRAGTNPVGSGLEWVRRRFVELAPPNTPVVVSIPIKVIDQGVEHVVEVKREQIFIPARIEDNPSINQAEYAATLATKPPAVRRALREGDWNVSADAFFADVWDPAIHICKPFKIPAGWYKFRSIDWGYVYPGMSSVQWFAVDTDGNMVCYRSYTCHGRNAQQLAQDIMIIERDNGEWNTREACSYLTGPLDNSCWGEHGHVGPTQAETLMENGVHVFKCTKDRQGMADQMRIRLVKRSPHPTITDDAGKPAYIVPGIRWFNTCWNHVRAPGGKKVKVGPIVTIPVLGTDETDHEKWDTKGNDHDADSCLRGDVEVLTDHGPVPIALLVGSPSRVLSTDGQFHDASAAFLTRINAGMVRVDFEGKSVCVTPDHRFLTPDGTWIRADKLDTVGYAVIPWTLSLSPEQFRSGTDAATTFAASTSSVTEGDYTATYGNTSTTSQFQQDHTSTTWMATGITTAQQTSASFLAENTSANTCANGWQTQYGRPSTYAQLIGLSEQRARGIAAQQESAGTLQMVSANGRVEGQRSLQSASFAERDTWHSLNRASAQRHVRRSSVETPASMTSSEFALPAGQNSWPHGSRLSRPAPGIAVRVLAVTPAANADSYCLTVPGMGAFALGNGVIVSNCGYACMSRPITGIEDKPGVDPQYAYESKLWDETDELAPRRASRTGYRNSW